MTIARLGPYRLGERLGSGASGTVYRATGPGGDVAVKVFHPELWDRADTERRWRREVRLGRSLNHPTLVRTLDAGVVQGERGPVRYLAMEFVDGETLRARLDRCGALDEATCRSVALGVVEALVVLHDADVIHGDVKPENVFLASDGTVRLMDLGLAWGAGPDGATTSTVPAARGTLRYAAPEVFSGPAGEVDGRCDLYSLGLVLRESLGGSPPGALNRLLDPILHEDPARRVATTRDFRAILRGEVEPRAEPLPHAHETRIHGRDAELSRLDARYRDATEGRGRTVVLEAEAGMGKSRLLAEFLATVGAAPGVVHVLRGSYESDEAGDVLSPYVQALRRRYGGDVLGTIARHVRVATDAGARFAEALAGDGDSASVLSEVAARAVLTEVLADLSTDAPTVVVVEDMHLGPASWEQTFALLAEALADCRVLLLATTRPTPRAPHEHPRVERIVLGPLAPDDVRALVEEWAGVHAEAARLGDALARASGGNPMTALEFLREMRTRGRLRRRAAGGWAVVGSADEVVLPATTAALLHARLELLGRSERDVVDAMAIGAADAAVDALAAVTGLPERDVDEALQHLDRRFGLVTVGYGRASLRHHLVRQALAEAMPPRLAAALHDAWADRLEGTASGPALDPMHEVEACAHRLQGRTPRRAAASVDRAVRLLRARLEPVRALALARRALDLPDVLVEHQRVAVLLTAAECARDVARTEEALAYASEAVAVAAGAGDGVSARRAASLRVLLLMMTGRDDDARIAAEVLREEAARAGDQRVLAVVLSRLAQLDASEGRVESARTYWAAATAAAASDTSPQVELDVGAAGILFVVRYAPPEEALRYVERMCDLAALHGTAVDRVRTRGSLLHVLGNQDRNAEVVAALGPALEEARSCGSLLEEAKMHVIGIRVNFVTRDLIAARRHAEDCLRIERRVGNPAVRVRALHMLVVVEWLAGRLARVREVGALARAAIVDLDVVPRTFIVCLNAGAAALLGRHEAAAEELRELDALGPLPPYLGMKVDMARGDLAWARGDPHEAVLSWERSLVLAQAASLPPFATGDTRCQLAVACHDVGRLDEARAHAASVEAGGEAAQRPYARTLPLATRALLGVVPIAEAEEALRRAPDHLLIDMFAHHLLWRAGAGAEHARVARRLLESLRRDAPPEDRDRMVEDVALHRAIVAAHPAEP